MTRQFSQRRRAAPLSCHAGCFAQLIRHLHGITINCHSIRKKECGRNPISRTSPLDILRKEKVSCLVAYFSGALDRNQVCASSEVLSCQQVFIHWTKRNWSAGVKTLLKIQVHFLAGLPLIRTWNVVWSLPHADFLKNKKIQEMWRNRVFVSRTERLYVFHRFIPILCSEWATNRTAKPYQQNTFKVLTHFSSVVMMRWLFLVFPNTVSSISKKWSFGCTKQFRIV